jgi:hypothetical protein
MCKFNSSWDAGIGKTAGAFSQVKISILQITLKIGAFINQKQQMRTRLFSLCIFEKSKNEKPHWYHCSKIRLVAHRGIESLFLANTKFIAR